MTAPTRLLGAADPYAITSSPLYDVLEHIPDLQPGIAIPTYAQMRRDSRLSAVLASYTLQIRRASWQIEPGECRPEVVRQVADDLGLPVAGDDKPGAARTRGVSWNDHLRSALQFLTYGHAAFELLAEVVDGRARLVALAERMPHTLSRIDSDPKTGELLGVTQDALWKQESPQIPAARLAFYCHDRENSWSGTSILRSSYAPWVLRRELMRVHATSARRFGMGVPTVEWAVGSDPGPQQISEAQQLASAARVGDQSGASLPPGASLVLRGLTGAVPDVLAYIKYLDSAMAGAALMPHMDLGTSEHGSRAVASTFVESWLLSLGSIAEEVADVATRQIAARIVGWNWGDEAVPRIVASGIGAKREVTAESLHQLLQAGALSADPALEAWVRREYRLPEREQSPPPPPVVPSTPVTASARPRARKRKAPTQPTLFAAAEDPEPATDFAALQQEWEQAKADLLAEWPTAAQPMVDDLTAQVEAAVEADDLGALGTLAVSAAVVAALSALIGDAGVGLAVTAAAGVVVEAAAQGFDIAIPDSPGEGRARSAASALAGVIAAGYATGAARAALQVAGPDVDPVVVGDAVRQHLAELGTSEAGWVADNIGGALTAAQNAGRTAALEVAPPTHLVADERLDRSTCGPCRQISGTVFNSLADALVAYGTGGYSGCEGGLRCRGIAVPYWT